MGKEGWMDGPWAVPDPSISLSLFPSLQPREAGGDESPLLTAYASEERVAPGQRCEQRGVRRELAAASPSPASTCPH